MVCVDVWGVNGEKNILERQRVVWEQKHIL